MLKTTKLNVGHRPRSTILPVDQRERRIRRDEEFRRYDPVVGDKSVIAALRDIQLRGINGAGILLRNGQTAYVFKGGPLAIEDKKAKMSSLDMRKVDPESVCARFDLVTKQASSVVTANIQRLRSTQSGRVELQPDEHTARGIAHLHFDCLGKKFLGLEGPGVVKAEIKRNLGDQNSRTDSDDQSLLVERIKTSLGQAAKRINTEIDKARLSAEQYQDLCARLRRRFSEEVAQVLADIVMKELQNELMYCRDSTRKILRLTLEITESGMVAPWWYVAEEYTSER